MRSVVAFVTGRTTAWVSLVACILVVGLAIFVFPQPGSTRAPLPTAALSGDSQRVDSILAEFPSGDTTVAQVVWHRAHGQALSNSDQAAIRASAAPLRSFTDQHTVVRPELSDNRLAMLATMTVRESRLDRDPVAFANAIEREARADLPSGIEVAMTGAVQQTATAASQLSGSQLRLLLASLVVVAVLLALILRRPVLWVVSLAVVASAVELTRVLASDLDSALGMPLTAEGTLIVPAIIASVSTLFTLVLIGGYRRSLAGSTGDRTALTNSVSAAIVAIAASATIVLIGFLALEFAASADLRALGLACAVGVVVAALLGLFLLPAALALVGRAALWPIAPPTRGESEHARSGWDRLARSVTARPTPIVVGSLVIMAVLSFGLTGAVPGSVPASAQSTNQSTEAQKVIDSAFTTGYENSAIMLVPRGVSGSTAVHAPTSLAMALDAVHSVTRVATHAGWSELAVSYDADAGSPKALATIRDLRTSIARYGGPNQQTLIGGPDAIAVDTAGSAIQARNALTPILAALLLIVLILLLRVFVAPVVLLIGAAIGLLGGLGVGTLIFTQVLGDPGPDPNTVLLAFVFVVILGVGSSVILALRARAERLTSPVQDAMHDAVATTGGALAGAGIVAAGAFACLAAALPDVNVWEVGLIVAVGVFLDAIVVRTLLVPSVALLLGRTFYWPSKTAS